MMHWVLRQSRGFGIVEHGFLVERVLAAWHRKPRMKMAQVRWKASMICPRLLSASHPVSPTTAAMAPKAPIGPRPHDHGQDAEHHPLEVFNP
jgi:hypothetical protein